MGPTHPGARPEGGGSSLSCSPLAEVQSLAAYPYLQARAPPDPAGPTQASLSHRKPTHPASILEGVLAYCAVSVASSGHNPRYWIPNLRPWVGGGGRRKPSPETPTFASPAGPHNPASHTRAWAGAQGDPVWGTSAVKLFVLGVHWVERPFGPPRPEPPLSLGGETPPEPPESRWPGHQSHGGR